MGRLQQLQLPGSRAQTQQLWCTGLVAPHVGSSQTRDQTCVSCIGRWTLIPLSQQGTPHPTFRFLYVVVCLLFVVVLLFVVHVHIPFRSLTSQRRGMHPHHQSTHDTGLK